MAGEPSSVSRCPGPIQQFGPDREIARKLLKNLTGRRRSVGSGNDSVAGSGRSPRAPGSLAGGSRQRLAGQKIAISTLSLIHSVESPKSEEDRGGAPS